MILPDVNVLVYAFRPDSPRHEICRTWLAAVVTNSVPFGLSPVALAAVVRITTNPRMHPMPSQLDQAIGFCDNLLDQPYSHVIEPGERHWNIFKRLCIETNTRGARITDAWFAALAIEWGCEWITFDRDFARFPGLQWRVPALA